MRKENHSDKFSLLEPEISDRKLDTEEKAKENLSLQEVNLGLPVPYVKKIILRKLEEAYKDDLLALLKLAVLKQRYQRILDNDSESIDSSANEELDKLGGELEKLATRESLSISKIIGSPFLKKNSPSRCKDYFKTFKQISWDEEYKKASHLLGPIRSLEVIEAQHGADFLLKLLKNAATDPDKRCSFTELLEIIAPEPRQWQHDTRVHILGKTLKALTETYDYDVGYISRLNTYVVQCVKDLADDEIFLREYLAGVDPSVKDDVEKILNNILEYLGTKGLSPVHIDMLNNARTALMKILGGQKDSISYLRSMYWQYFTKRQGKRRCLLIRKPPPRHSPASYFLSID